MKRRRRRRRRNPDWRPIVGALGGTGLGLIAAAMVYDATHDTSPQPIDDAEPGRRSALTYAAAGVAAGALGGYAASLASRGWTVPIGLAFAGVGTWAYGVYRVSTQRFEAGNPG